MSKIVDGKTRNRLSNSFSFPYRVGLRKGVRFPPVYVPRARRKRERHYLQNIEFPEQDGTSWTKCDVRGEFSNVARNPIPHLSVGKAARPFSWNPRKK